jgi:hypothetical protein
MSSPSRHIEEVRNLKRKQSNKESSRRSRVRKQQQVEELIAETSRLQEENARLKAQIGAYMAKLGKLNAENAVLHALHGEPSGMQLRPSQSPLAPGAAVNIPNDPMPPVAPQLADQETVQVDSVIPSDQWTWNYMEIAGIDAYYGVPDIPEI